MKGRNKNNKSEEKIDKAFLYLVKMPSNNDITVCASKNRLEKGEKVIYSTRFGLDLGVVVGSANNFVLGSRGRKYTPGKTCVCGACRFGHLESKADPDLVYMADPPEFRFAKYNGQITLAQGDEKSDNWDGLHSGANGGDVSENASGKNETLGLERKEDVKSPSDEKAAASIKVSSQGKSAADAASSLCEKCVHEADDAFIQADMGEEGAKVTSGKKVDLDAASRSGDAATVKDDSEFARQADVDSRADFGFGSLRRDEEMMEVDGDVEYIERIASAEEIQRYEENEERSVQAARICKQKIAERGLDMKLVNVHFLLCEPKALFFFSAEDRVDFRELVRDLVSIFKMRIELRQIGVRDESRLLGGIAVCGRDFCCHSVFDKLKPVTIKMAKDQDLSLNSTKISGPCGRLLCCLSYENDFYTEEKASYPVEGTKIQIGEYFFRVVENNILTKKTKLASEEGGDVVIDRRELVFHPEGEYWSVSQKFMKEFLSE